MWVQVAAGIGALATPIWHPPPPGEVAAVINDGPIVVGAVSTVRLSDQPAVCAVWNGIGGRGIHPEVDCEVSGAKVESGIIGDAKGVVDTVELKGAVADVAGAEGGAVDRSGVATADVVAAVAVAEPPAGRCYRRADRCRRCRQRCPKAQQSVKRPTAPMFHDTLPQLFHDTLPQFSRRDLHTNGRLKLATNDWLIPTPGGGQRKQPSCRIEPRRRLCLAV